VDYALQKGCYFVTGHELIEEIKKMQADEQFGAAGTMADAVWQFYKNSALNSTAVQQTYTGNIVNASVTVAAASGDEYPEAGYGLTKGAGYFRGLTHIELTYKTTAPLILRLVMSTGEIRQVYLGNVGPETPSGRIPVSAFQGDPENTVPVTSAINTANITGIEVELITSGAKAETHTFTVKDLKLYGASAAVLSGRQVNSRMSRDVAVSSLSRSLLRLKVAKSGRYDVSLIAQNGKVISAVGSQTLKAGIMDFRINNLSGGVYVVRIQRGNEVISVRCPVL
jgi:hypothetical protein